LARRHLASDLGEGWCPAARRHVRYEKDGSRLRRDLARKERPRFQYQFSPVFNAQTFLLFLKLLVCRSRRKIFLVIDNGPCHNLDADGQSWLMANRPRIELFRLPPYSPEFNPTEGVWKQTKKRTTHNTFYRTMGERDAALTATFESFRAHPALIAPQVARFLG
jgi:transposase